MRWEQTRPPVEFWMVGVDEKYLGRRGKNRTEKSITIVSKLETGEPLWIGPERRERHGYPTGVKFRVHF